VIPPDELFFPKNDVGVDISAIKVRAEIQSNIPEKSTALLSLTQTKEPLKEFPSNNNNEDNEVTEETEESEDDDDDHYETSTESSDSEESDEQVRNRLVIITHRETESY